MSQQFLALEQAPRYAENFGSRTTDEPDDVHDEAWAEALLRDEPVKRERDSFELQPTEEHPEPITAPEPKAAIEFVAPAAPASSSPSPMTSTTPLSRVWVISMTSRPNRSARTKTCVRHLKNPR